MLAEEEAFTVREREIAERRKVGRPDRRRAATPSARACASPRKAEAEREAAASLAEAQRIAAKAEADAVMIRASAAAEQFKVDAEGARAANEADNVLTVEARASRARHEAARQARRHRAREREADGEDRRASTSCMSTGINGGEGGRKNVTDEVIDSALRYRVQAPMIDSLMKEVGIEGGSIGRMTDVLRDAKDLDSIVRNRKKDAGAGPNGPARRRTATTTGTG